MTKNDKYPYSLKSITVIACFLALFIIPGMSGYLYAAGTNTITVKVFERSVIKRDKIRLGKIAGIKGENPAFVRKLNDIVIGKAPLPGKSRRIDEGYIKIRLKQNHIDLSQIKLIMPGKVEVSRSYTEVSKKKIEQVISNFVLGIVPWKKESVRINKVCVRNNVVLPEGNISYRVVPPKSSDFLGTIPLSVLFMVNGRLQKKLWATINIEVLTEMIVTKRPLKRHQLITEDHIQVKKMYLAKAKSNVVTSCEEVLGKRTKRTINANEIIRTNYIELPPLVRRGEVVTIIAESDGLRVTALGEIQRKGCRGERIRVVNLDTNKKLYARVLDSNTVKVDF